jgi:hypothetical protein
MEQLVFSVNAGPAVSARQQNAQPHESEWQSIPFPGRMLAIGLLIHASFENAIFAFERRG